MKKTSCCLGLFLVILLMISLVSCNYFDFNVNDDYGDQSETAISFSSINKTRMISSAHSSSQELYYSFTDGTNNYFYFYLGHVEKVPISYEAAETWLGGVAPTLSYTVTEYDEKQIEQSTKHCVSNTISEKNTASLNVGVTGKLSSNVKVNAEIGLQSSNTSTSTRSTTQTTTSVTTWSQSHSKTVSYTLDNSCAFGYYRYTLFATCDMYAIVVCDKQSHEINYEYVSCARPNTYHYAIDYSENEYFDNNSNTDNLEFDFEVLDQVDLYGNLDNMGSEDIIAALPSNATVCSNENHLKIVASGNYFDSSNATDWGLSHEADEIDLTKYEEYMTDKYIWTFDVSVKIKEHNDGYQELYLYNRLVKKGSVSSSDTFSQSDAEQNGMLCYEKNINHSSGGSDHFTYSIPFEVNGSKCREKMYIRYGAHGDFSDDWTKESIVVKITIKENK